MSLEGQNLFDENKEGVRRLYCLPCATVSAIHDARADERVRCKQAVITRAARARVVRAR